MASLRDNIIDILVKTKHVSMEQLQKALDTHKQNQVPLRRVFIEQGIITEEELLLLLSKELYIPTLHLTKYKFSPDVTSLIAERIVRQYNVIPLSRMGNTLTVAISDPLNIFALDDLKTMTGLNIDTVLSPEEEIAAAINSQYRSQVEDMQQIIDEDSADGGSQAKEGVELLKEDNIELSSFVSESQKAPIVKLVDIMLSESLKRRASDIHIEPEHDSLKVRYRIDGALNEAFKIPKSNQNAVLARLKIISNLDITESRIPQDGRFKVKLDNKEVDFRVSALPTTFGQKFVLRALDKANLSIGLDTLGFSPLSLENFKKAVNKPFGMILVTGPTGSGKSTTLYSVLNQLNTPERNIITIEDPVEYQVDGITQIPVRHDIGLDFASGLRAILRQSPDVIMIGEIRDSETADIAIKASLTGQVVLSTLHTNDAITSITRLIDMGIEPFLVASSIVLLCAQRLCRKLCMKCRKPVEVSQEYLDKAGFNFKEKVTFYQPGGCKSCNNTGYYGRLAILETVFVDDTIREMIIKKESIDDIKLYAQKAGMRMLRDDAFLKVKDELTTIEEAMRITTEE